MADCQGVLEYDLELIKGQLFPYDNFGRKHMKLRVMIDNLVTQGFIECAECNYSREPAINIPRKDYLLCVIDFVAACNPHKSEKPKFRIESFQGTSRDASTNKFVVSWFPVPGSRSPAPGSRETVSGTRFTDTAKATDVGAPLPPTAVGRSDVRAKAGGEGAPPHCAHPPEAPEPPMTPEESGRLMDKWIAEMQQDLERKKAEKGRA